MTKYAEGNPGKRVRERRERARVDGTTGVDTGRVDARAVCA